MRNEQDILHRELESEMLIAELVMEMHETLAEIQKDFANEYDRLRAAFWCGYAKRRWYDEELDEIWKKGGD